MKETKVMETNKLHIPLGQKNQETCRDKKNHATFRDKKSRNPRDKKIKQPLETKEIT